MFTWEVNIVNVEYEGALILVFQYVYDICLYIIQEDKNINTVYFLYINCLKSSHHGKEI